MSEFTNMGEKVLEHKALFGPIDFNEDKEDGVEVEGFLEPTIENLELALRDDKIEKSKYFHAGSKIMFELQPLSSEGYLAIRHAVVIDPETGEIKSTQYDDDREIQINYLLHGVSSPKLSRTAAELMLNKKGWGASNTGLIDAIIRMNPSPENHMNPVIGLSAFCRFGVTLFNIMKTVGSLDDFYDKYNIKVSAREKLNNAIDMFSEFYAIDETAKGWGIPLDIESLVIPDEDSLMEKLEEEKKNREDEVKVKDDKEEGEVENVKVEGEDEEKDRESVNEGSKDAQ